MDDYLTAKNYRDDSQAGLTAAETSFSQIADFFAERIYAVTEQGVELTAFLA